MQWRIVSQKFQPPLFSKHQKIQKRPYKPKNEKTYFQGFKVLCRVKSGEIFIISFWRDFNKILRYIDPIVTILTIFSNSHTLFDFNIITTTQSSKLYPTVIVNHLSFLKQKKNSIIYSALKNSKKKEKNYNIIS